MATRAIKEIHTVSDDQNDLFYLGYLLNSGPYWTLVQVIAEDCTLGSLMLIRNDEISEVLDESANIDFLTEEMKNRGLLDVMNLHPYVEQVLEQKIISLKQALNYSLSMKQAVVLATLTGEQLVGYVTNYNEREVRLNEIDYYEKELNTYDTVIPLNDIIMIHLFNEETALLDSYFATAEDTHFSGNLVELFMNFNDERDNWPWVGVISAQNDSYYLFERISPVGTLGSLELINRKYVYYIAKDSSNLNYYRFIVSLKQQLNSFDIDHIELRMHDLNSVPTFSETLANKKEKELFTVNNQEFDGPDTGLLTGYDNEHYQMSLVNNMQFLNDLENFKINKTISMSIWSGKTAMMSSILKKHE